MTCRSRRDALRRLAGIPLVVPSLLSRLVAGTNEDDGRIAGRIFRRAGEQSLQSAPMGDILVAVARQFLGSPYAARTLEQEGDEHLVVNLREFDCVTLVESSLALARCIATGVHTLDGVGVELTRIRYRRGVIHGYASRLHYFSDWIFDNARKGVVRDETPGLAGVPERKTINFMTSRPQEYPRLRDAAVRTEMMQQEHTISGRPRFFIQKDDLPAVEKGIQDGDILGITTDVPGLDIVHAGIALRVGGRLCSLHAPMTGGVVALGERPLAEVLRLRSSLTGVVVARPLRPAVIPAEH